MAARVESPMGTNDVKTICFETIGVPTLCPAEPCMPITLIQASGLALEGLNSAYIWNRVQSRRRDSEVTYNLGSSITWANYQTL